jgi:hypothetical protein
VLGLLSGLTAPAKTEVIPTEIIEENNPNDN